MLAATAPLAAMGDVCLPPGITLGGGVAGANAAGETRHGDAAVYIDQSTSMMGFTRPAPGQPRTYADTILGLRQVLEQVSTTASLYLFGRDILSLPASQLTAAIQSSTYLCRRSRNNSADGNSCESRIDKVLDTIAKSSTDTLSLIVTDLFLSDKDMVGSEYGTMRNSLENVLRAGKSIGVLGISAPFDGLIYDIPGQRAYPQRGNRPFFILMIGSDDRQIGKLLDLTQHQLLTDLPAKQRPFALFTLHPARPAGSTVALRFDDSKAVRPDIRWPIVPDGVPDVVLANDAAPTAHLALANREEPSTLPLGGFQVEASLWVYRDGGPCQSRWVAWQQPHLLSAEGNDGKPVLTFDASQLHSLPPQTFLLRATVTATRVAQASGVTDWLHDWSFGADQAAAVVRRRPKLFPVLNLGQLADTLTEIVRSDFKPITVGDYVAVFRKAD